MVLVEARHSIYDQVELSSPQSNHWLQQAAPAGSETNSSSIAHQRRHTTATEKMSLVGTVQLGCSIATDG